MEVHHHASHGGKKNWRSYFWEFYAVVGVQVTNTILHTSPHQLPPRCR
jgi:hypothetical protein